MPREFAFPGTRDRYAPSRVCDVQHYCIELDVDVANRAIKGKCTLSVSAIGKPRLGIELDAVELARMQFALNISFHILFPAITIGLAWVLLYFRVRYTLSRNQAWEFAYYFWVKVFALSFALGVVSGCRDDYVGAFRCTERHDHQDAACVRFLLAERHGNGRDEASGGAAAVQNGERKQ